MEQQIPDPVKDYLTIHPKTQAVIFAPTIFRLTYDSRRRLLSACGIKRTSDEKHRSITNVPKMATFWIATIGFSIWKPVPQPNTR